ncbi:hypothetical protein [Burkholderia anthina]|uniref:hypothetical protein n=1 Tax=Burkholderia anthina TaxID=179879 RepID=UPI0037BFD373
MRRIIELVIENPEITSCEVAALLYERDIDGYSPEMKRVRVALHGLCKLRWLSRRLKEGDGVYLYRYSRRWPPKKDAVIHRPPDSPPPAVGRLATAMVKWGKCRTNHNQFETTETLK